MQSLGRAELLFLLFISHVLALRNMGLLLVIPVLAVFANTLEGATPFLAGLSIGIYGLVQAVFQIPFGMVSDRIGRKRTVMGGLLLFSIGNVVAAGADHVVLLVAGRALMGMGAITSVCFAWISDRIPPERRNQSFGIVTLIVSPTAFLSLLLGPILYHFFSLPPVFWGCALLALSGSITLWMFVPEEATRGEKQVSSRKASFQILLGLFRQPHFLLHCWMGLFMNYFLTAVFFTVPIELKELSTSAALWKYLVPIAGASFLLLIPITRLADRGHVRGVIQAGFATEFLAAAALLAEPTLTVLVLALFLFLTGYIMLGPALPASLSRGYGSSDYGVVMGGYSMFLFTGSFLGATVSGLLYSGGPAWIGVSLVVISLTGSWVNIRLRSKEGLSGNELDAGKIDNPTRNG